MKSLIRRTLGRAVQNDSIWTVLNATVIPAAEYAKWQRSTTKRQVDALLQNAITAISPELTVKHGPFAGMEYPPDFAEKRSVVNAFVPKILGSYEKEIQPILEDACSQPYGEIVDIGCAEGYYAVGLARRIPTARVFAYDTSAEAVPLCRQLARANKVGDRLVTGAFCDPAALRSIPFTGRALIISDCEGYEKELFTEEIVPFLAHHDLLIETHDFIDIEISPTIRQRFQDTHVIRDIQSVDDIQKAHSYGYDELKGYTLAERRILLAEHRPSIMEWFYMTPRTSRQP
ncbi:MAG TPA: class I SAM-dependent methyltransferase [Verrucomicrobiae bacterium]|nr:class I SAM-dependent methyltransferase [Verrucomicrobiae bacterium]